MLGFLALAVGTFALVGLMLSSAALRFFLTGAYEQSGPAPASNYDTGR